MNYPEQPIDPPEYEEERDRSDDWKKERDMEAAEMRWESDRDDRLLSTGRVKP
jgi:hypothetical protein